MRKVLIVTVLTGILAGAAGPGSANPLLETWDTTVVPDGSYSIRVRVVDKTGNYREIFANGVLVANTAPTATRVPTSTPAPTETYTPAATPTFSVPTAPLAQPSPTPTLARPTRSALPEGVDPTEWRQSICLGAQLMAALLVVLGSLMLFEGEAPESRLGWQVLLPTLLAVCTFFTAVALVVFRAQRAKPRTGPAGLVGEIGFAKTALTPEGKVFVHGELWNAVGRSPLPEGSRVRVMKVTGLRLEVEAVETDRPRG